MQSIDTQYITLNALGNLTESTLYKTLEISDIHSTALQVNNLTIGYGNRTLARDISF